MLCPSWHCVTLFGHNHKASAKIKDKNINKIYTFIDEFHCFSLFFSKFTFTSRHIVYSMVNVRILFATQTCVRDS